MKTVKELQAELDKLNREYDQLRAVKNNDKVRRTAKDAIAVWVLNRKPPITLTPDQWGELINRRRHEINALIQLIQSKQKEKP